MAETLMPWFADGLGPRAMPDEPSAYRTPKLTPTGAFDAVKCRWSDRFVILRLYATIRGVFVVLPLVRTPPRFSVCPMFVGLVQRCA